jgi:hypothetical protein
MKRSSMLLALVALGFSARAADAQQTYMQACIADCNASLGGTTPQNIAIRGWCYLLNCTG